MANPPTQSAFGLPLPLRNVGAQIGGVVGDDTQTTALTPRNSGSAFTLTRDVIREDITLNAAGTINVTMGLPFSPHDQIAVTFRGDGVNQPYLQWPATVTFANHSPFIVPKSGFVRAVFVADNLTGWSCATSGPARGIDPALIPGVTAILVPMEQNINDGTGIAAIKNRIAPGTSDISSIGATVPLQQDTLAGVNVQPNTRARYLNVLAATAAFITGSVMTAAGWTMIVCYRPKQGSAGNYGIISEQSATFIGVYTNATTGLEVYCNEGDGASGYSDYPGTVAGLLNAFHVTTLINPGSPANGVTRHDGSVRAKNAGVQNWRNASGLANTLKIGAGGDGDSLPDIVGIVLAKATALDATHQNSPVQLIEARLGALANLSL